MLELHMFNDLGSGGFGTRNILGVYVSQVH